jgi:hypothetical protein
MTANDVCDACEVPITDKGSKISLDSWSNRTQTFLNNVTSTMSNVYINLIGTLDLSNVHRVQQMYGFCKFEHEKVLTECGCVDKGNATELALLDQNIHVVNAELHRIAQKYHDEFKASGRKDVAIVMQGFQEGIGAEIDKHFFSELDCFHPSSAAHQDLAVGLWNSMLCTDDRAHLCGHMFEQNQSPLCPTKDSRFYTGPDVIPVPGTSKPKAKVVLKSLK